MAIGSTLFLYLDPSAKMQYVNTFEWKSTKMYMKDKYDKLSDQEIISLVVEKGNEEVLTFLLYEKYYNRFCFLAYRYYRTLYYLDDLIDELYIHLKGDDRGWKVLRSFQFKSKLETWTCRVASNLFQEKRAELIGFQEKTVSINVSDMKDVMDLPESEPDYDPLDAVLLLEAISCLEDEDDRFILLKELEGYSPKELSQMLAEKWKKRGQIKIRKVPNTSDGSVKEVIPTVGYIYTRKSRVLKEVSTIMNELKKECL